MNVNDLIRTIEHFDFVRKVDVKSMFGGKRLFTDGVPFCQFFDGKLYFRTNAVEVPLLKKQGYEQLETFKNQSLVKHNYFVVPDLEISDLNKLKSRLKSSLEDAKREKEDALRNLRIKDLPNLRVQVERSLSRVGITTVTELREHGPIEAFIKLRQLNNNVSLDLLYSLSAALRGIHKNVLSNSEKEILRISLDMAA